MLNILPAVFLFSCGLEEYYDLPQVPQINIKTIFNTDAVIVIPAVPDPPYYYATNYSIFYRIYISESDVSTEISSPAQRSQISASLASDFNALEQFTNPANSSVPSASTFRNRNYFELEFEGSTINSFLTTIGVTLNRTLNIKFPTEPGGFPVVFFDNDPEIRLRRSGNLISPEPIGDPFLRNTPALNNTINADVSARSGNYAYISMYIVAVGYDNSQFTPIYSKPTHISIFKLPDVN
jgi:hypothetical protein